LRQPRRFHDNRAAVAFVSIHLDALKATNMDEPVQNLQVLLSENTAATIQTNCVGSFQIIAPSHFWTSFQEQAMDEDAPTNVKAPQAAATKRSGR
jgi:hypothetical protein